MGQNTDTKNIFQIGKNNKKYIWDSKYLEKKKNESNIYIFLSLEIEKFIKKKFKDNGLNLYKYKINFLESSIKICVFYFKTFKSQNIINQINNNQKIRLIKKKKFKNNKKIIKPYLNQKKIFINKNNIFLNLITSKLNKNFLFIKSKLFFLTELILNKVLEKKLSLNNIFIKKIQEKLEIFTKSHFKEQNQLKKIITRLLIDKTKIKLKKRIKILQFYKYFIKLQKNKIIKNIKINNFLEKIIESLNIFTNNKFNIVLNLQQINNNLTFLTSYQQLQHFKKTIIQLRQFKKSKFFKEGVNVIFLSVIKKDSSQLLADFISNQLKLVKRHGFFLKFIKKTLSLLLKNKFIKTTSVKLVIKGRFNGKRRSNKKTITVNKYMPLMLLKSNINFAQSTSYSSNGTFGVKLWVNEK